MISAGGDHSLLLTNGDLWSFGYGQYRQLGHNNLEDQLVPKKVEAFAGKYVQGIAAGLSHSFALLDGELHSFGIGLYGMLGHGDEQNQALPKKITAFDGKLILMRRPMKIVRSYWFPRERTFLHNGFEERDLERGGLVVGICRVWVYHGIMWKGVEDFFFDLVSYFYD